MALGTGNSNTTRKQGAPTPALAPEFDKKNKPALVERPSIRNIEKSRHEKFEGRRDDALRSRS
jgi:hypothetical protein